MRKVLVLFTLLLLPLIALYGCGGGEKGPLGDISTDTGTASKTGSLTVSARFPQDGKKGEIGTALIDENTARIVASVYDSLGNYYSVELTPQNPTGRIANIPVGNVYISISTYDSAGNVLEYLNVAGEIVEGENTLTATLIRGSWQLVDPNNQPTSIRLNKTLSTDTTTLMSFSVIPWWYYGARKVSIDPTKPYGESEYSLLWKGSGFSYDFCGSTEVCWWRENELEYFNQFIGPSTNRNTINENEGIPLQPTSDYVPTVDSPTNRKAFIIGSLEDITFSDPDVINYFNSRVTGANTMEGTILEILTKSRTGTETCYDMAGNEITCPWQTGPASRSNKGLSKAIAKAMSEGVGKAAINQQGCFIDLNVSGTDEWEDCAGDLDRDGRWCEYPDDFFRVVETWDWTGDACVHPFKAIGSQLPTTDLNLIIQKKAKK